ncbi:uncharacterized protein senp5 [Fundulus heteroclitus]|uniref:uncharacterized protein senp5 n=1 Tax=Fundulus heteroclitus TaxID=8078 RepID=UPI00165C29BA|nr:uncharacterized protein senp5 [Fundulus heteroclitus]XP_035996822.1 uncharacterized protein senp5 [Fundulus heteroclitus]
MVHSNSNSPMTTPSTSLHRTVCSKAPLLVSCPRGAAEQDLNRTSADPTSHSESTQTPSQTPADAPRHVAKGSGAKSSSAPSRPHTPAPTSTQDQLNGRRSGRKRTPKACDCCGPNSRGHNVESSGRSKGKARGRGAGGDLADTPQRKPPKLTAIRNFKLTVENVQESEDEGNGLGNFQTSGPLAEPPSRSPATKPVPAVTRDGPKRNCAPQTNRAAQTKEDISTAPSEVTVAGEKGGVDERAVDPPALGPAGRGAKVVRGRGRGAATGRGRGKTKMEGVQATSKDKGHVTSSRKGALAEPVLEEEPERTQDVHSDHENQKNSASDKRAVGNGELVQLSDSEDEMEEDSIIVTELADGVLTIPRKSARLDTFEDLDSEMQVDQVHDGADHVSLLVPLPNGNVASPRNHHQGSSPVGAKTSRSAPLAPLEPITVSTEDSWALKDHRLYCHPCSWAKDEMSMEDPAEDTAMDADTQNQENLEQLKYTIQEFLESFYIKYGSFIPLTESDVLEHLKKNGNCDVSSSEVDIKGEMTRYRAGLASAPVAGFMVTYNKHNLRLEDLGTLEDQNWLNDQIINMYGELIMDVAEQKVHFFNSFFYKKLVAKGYDGVKRWTKKVDLFSKWLLLIPIHLEIHWSLIAVTMATKTISYYDSQGIVFRHTTNNIMKYLQAEAREKKQAAFQKGWKIAIIKGIPQQKNDSDCGVFVLEYCRRLSVKQPLLFSQNDMPQIRKRIYKELCDCRFND